MNALHVGIVQRVRVALSSNVAIRALNHWARPSNHGLWKNAL